MKNILIIFTSLLILSCSRTIPEDIHEHEEPNKLMISYSEENSTLTKVAEFNIGTNNTPILDLENGKIYDVEISFFHDDEDLTSDVITEANEHFMQYLFANLDVVIERRNDDAIRDDGNKLGLKMKWTINSVPANSSVNVQLIHDAESVDDTANNGAGSSNGGEPDVDVVFLIQ